MAAITNAGSKNIPRSVSYHNKNSIYIVPRTRNVRRIPVHSSLHRAGETIFKFSPGISAFFLRKEFFFSQELDKMSPLKSLLVLVFLFAAGSTDISKLKECYNECQKLEKDNEIINCTRECIEQAAPDGAGSDPQKIPDGGIEKWFSDLDSVLQNFPKQEAEERLLQFLNNPEVKQTVDGLREAAKVIPWQKMVVDAVKELQELKKSNAAVKKAAVMINPIMVCVVLAFSAIVF
ncbi:hypothetical protein Aduo_010237 [Ancylostoma duodenale]